MFLEPNVRLPSMSTPAITAAMAIARAPAASAALYPWMSASVPGMVFGVEPRPAGLPGYDVRYCAVEPGRVRSDQGICVDVRHGLEMMAGADIVVVPAWNHPETPASPALVTALRRAHQGGAKVVGLCLGAFVLGDAGLLDGRPATTHWARRDLFAERFPQALFHPDVLYVDDADVVTSAGTVAAIDCCLNILRRRHGADVANRVARLLVTPSHRQGGQAQYIEQPVPSAASETRLAGVLEWARKNPAQPLSLDALAGVARMSRRTFTRRFKEATGTTFDHWVTTERIARAQQLLDTSNFSVERVAAEAGFGSAVSLRQHFMTQLKTSPTA